MPLRAGGIDLTDVSGSAGRCIHSNRFQAKCSNAVSGGVGPRQQINQPERASQKEESKIPINFNARGFHPFNAATKGLGSYVWWRETVYLETVLKAS